MYDISSTAHPERKPHISRVEVCQRKFTLHIATGGAYLIRAKSVSEAIHVFRSLFVYKVAELPTVWHMIYAR